MVPSTTSNLISFETIEKRSLKNSPHFPCSCRHNASQNYIYRYTLARVVFFIIFSTENGLRLDETGYMETNIKWFHVKPERSIPYETIYEAEKNGQMRIQTENVRSQFT